MYIQRYIYYICIFKDTYIIYVYSKIHINPNPTPSIALALALGLTLAIIDIHIEFAGGHLLASLLVASLSPQTKTTAAPSPSTNQGMGKCIPYIDI